MGNVEIELIEFRFLSNGSAVAVSVDNDDDGIIPYVTNDFKNRHLLRTFFRWLFVVLRLSVLKLKLNTACSPYTDFV